MTLESVVDTTTDEPQEILNVPDSGVRSNAPLAVDIGQIVSECGDDCKFIDRVKSLSTAEKYGILKSHSRPSDKFDFPKTYTGGCNRNFKLEWLDQHKWLGYSTKLDGAFCLPCTVFNGSLSPSGQKIMGGLVTRPFRTWQKKSEKFKEHECSKYHQAAMQLADELIRTVEHPETAVPALVNSRRAANITRNRVILKSIARANDSVLWQAVHRLAW